jgi:uncharacterized cofD-like protein
MQANKPPRFTRIKMFARREMRWLAPGIGVKRYLLLLLAGTTLLSVGLAMFALDVYRTAPETWWLPILSAISLQEFERPVRVLVFGTLGIGIFLYGVWGLNRSLLKPFMRPGKAIVDTVSNYRRKERGPRIVAIGGGTGLAALLRGLKTHTNNLTAIVTVADDGGSSGELRRTIGVLPPGDIRNCLAALSDDEELITQIFQYRFGTSAGINGHSLGNLFITAMAEITGSFEQAVAESGRVLAVRGKVMPSTLHDVRLVADLFDLVRNQEVRVKGESNIPTQPGKVNRVWLEPNNPEAYPPAIQAILNADLILIGPGSLYTSLLPNLLVPDIAAAIRASRAFKFYLCNVATQPGETDGYTCLDHVMAIERHLKGRVFELVICNNQTKGKLPDKVQYVVPGPNLDEHYPAYCADLLDEVQPWRHDSQKIAKVIMDLLYERTGPMINREDDLMH